MANTNLKEAKAAKVVITKVPPLAKTAALTASKLENIVASLNSEVIALLALAMMKTRLSLRLIKISILVR